MGLPLNETISSGPYSPAMPSFAKMSVELKKPLPEMTSMVEAFTLPSASRNLNSTLAGAASRLATTRVDLKLPAFVVEGISSFTCGTPFANHQTGILREVVDLRCPANDVLIGLQPQVAFAICR